MKAQFERMNRQYCQTNPDRSDPQAGLEKADKPRKRKLSPNSWSERDMIILN